MCKQNDAEELVAVHMVKERLYMYRNRDRDIDCQLKRLELLESRIFSIGSPKYSDMPKGSSVVGDKVADMIAEKVDIESDIQKLREDKQSERLWIEEIIAKLEDPNERNVIRARYLDGGDWKDVCEVIYGWRNDYFQKEKSYLRNITNIHRRALLNIARCIQ